MLQQLQVGFQCKHHRHSEVWSAAADSDDSHVLVAGMSISLVRSLHHHHPPHHHPPPHQQPLLCYNVSHSTPVCTWMTNPHSFMKKNLAKLHRSLCKIPWLATRNHQNSGCCIMMSQSVYILQCQISAMPGESL